MYAALDGWKGFEASGGGVMEMVGMPGITGMVGDAKGHRDGGDDGVEGK